MKEAWEEQPDHLYILELFLLQRCICN